MEKNKHLYPYQNLILVDMEGEIWEDVPGFDGAYQISNYGRIKSLRRWRGAGREGGYYTEERILKPRVSTKPNKLLNTVTYSLGASFKLDGKVRSTTIGKYVYYVFVAPFDLDDPDLVVTYRDCDGRNLKPENLVLTDRSGLIKRAFQLDRAVNENKLPVLQLDMKGKVVARYSSLTEAAYKTGFFLGAIAECTRGHIFQHKGYRWALAVDRKPGRHQKMPQEETFNKSLWQKLGQPRTSMNDPIPALNLSTKSLEGEIWKPIVGLGGNYQVSSQGRVKSCSRFKGNNVWLKEHVLRLVADGNKNRPASSLLACLSKEGRKCQQSVAKLVYFHFVKKFDLNDKKRRIHYKDGIFFNLVPDNLVLK